MSLIQLLVLAEPGISKEFIMNLECTALPSRMEYSINRYKAIPQSYKICIKATSLSESNYSKLANGEGKLEFIFLLKPQNGVSVNATPVRRIFCRPKPFCKL